MRQIHFADNKAPYTTNIKNPKKKKPRSVAGRCDTFHSNVYFILLTTVYKMW